MYLELLVDHHTSIHSLLKHLSAFTSASILAANAEEASRAVSRLAGLLTVHLAAEDKFLYPNLARSEDEHIRTTAARFDEEMGHLASTFLSYKEAWMTPTKIRQNPAACLDATKEVLAALQERLGREDAQLYPLLQD